jgi:hypothetical protein
MGVPDLNYCYNGVEGWIEMKRASGLRCHVEPEQIAWMERRARAGGRTFLAVRRITKPTGFWLFRGTDARQLGRLEDVKPLLFSMGNPASWPWSKVKTLLTA